MRKATTVELAEVVECLDKQRKPVKQEDRVHGDVPYFGANGQQGWIDQAIFDESLIIVAEDGGHFENPQRGVAYTVHGPSWINNHGHVLRPSSAVEFGYLFRILQNYDFMPYVSGSTRLKLTQQQLMRVQIPLPPIDEQRRIAAILDAADAIRAKRRQQLARLDSLTQSIFHDMFSKAQPSAELGDVCTKVTDGTHQSPQWANSGVPFLFVSNITSGQINFDTKKFVSEETWKRLTRRTPIEIGDVLYSTVGSFGVPAVVRTSARFIFQRHIAHLKVDKERVLPDFLATQLATPGLYSQATRVARGIAQPTVNLRDIKKFKIIVPDIKEQRNFTHAVEEVQGLRASFAVALASAEELFVSLQSRAFGGAL